MNNSLLGDPEDYQNGYDEGYSDGYKDGVNKEPTFENLKSIYDAIKNTPVYTIWYEHTDEVLRYVPAPDTLIGRTPIYKMENQVVELKLTTKDALFSAMMGHGKFFGSREEAERECKRQNDELERKRSEMDYKEFYGGDIVFHKEMPYGIGTVKISLSDTAVVEFDKDGKMDSTIRDRFNVSDLIASAPFACGKEVSIVEDGAIHVDKISNFTYLDGVISFVTEGGHRFNIPGDYHTKVFENNEDAKRYVSENDKEMDR